jgi:hypothetical protein
MDMSMKCIYVCTYTHTVRIFIYRIYRYDGYNIFGSKDKLYGHNGTHTYIYIYRVLQTTTYNHIGTYITRATSNFSMLCLEVPNTHEQKWPLFLKAAKHIIQSTTLNWGTGATKRLWSSTS